MHDNKSTGSRPGGSAVRPAPLTLAAAFGLLVAIGVWLVLTLNPTFAWGGDNAMYLMHARNLVEGVAYNATGYIQNPFSYLAPPAYPPGFPIVLAPAYALLGLDILAFKYYMIAIYVVALALYAGYCYDGFRNSRYAGACWLVAIALVGLNPKFYGWVTLILSEGVFLVVLIACLWTIRTAYDRFDNGHDGLWLAVGGGLLAACVVSTRVYGAALIPCIVLYDLTRYRTFTRVGLVAFSCALLFWLLETVWLRTISIAPSVGVDNGYLYLLRHDFLGQIHKLPETIRLNFLGYATIVNNYWSTRMASSQWLVAIGVYLSFALAAWGFVQRVVTRYTLLEVFFVGYFLAILPWHSFGTRYLVPLVPFYFFYLLLGVNAAENLVRLRIPALLGLVTVAAALTYTNAGLATADFEHKISASAANGAPAMATYDYIQRNTDPDAVFIVRDPRILALFTRRRSATYTDNSHENRIPDDDKLIRFFRDIGARYMLATPSDPRLALQWLASRHRDVFRPIYRKGSFVLYRLSAPGESDPGALIHNRRGRR